MIEQQDLEKGIRDFTAFWAKKNEVDLKDARFNVLVKKIEIPKEWEKDFLKNQMKQPWEDAGYIKWIEYEIFPSIKIIEEL